MQHLQIGQTEEDWDGMIEPPEKSVRLLLVEKGRVITKGNNLNIC